MIVSSYNGQLLDLEKTLDIIQHRDFAKNRIGRYECFYGWLDEKPLIIRCHLNEWRKIEKEL